MVEAAGRTWDKRLPSCVDAYPSKRCRSAWIGIAVHSGQSIFLAIIVLTLVVQASPYRSTDHARVEGRGTSPYPWRRASLSRNSKRMYRSAGV